MEQSAFIEEVMEQAAKALISTQDEDLRIKVKQDTSIVTQADLASEKVILAAIAAAFPDDIVYSEEAGLSSDLRRAGTYIWIIDPLDGTTNFANGYPFFCISVARGIFLPSGRIEVLVGGVRDVPKGRTYLATKGKGATVDGVPLQVAPTRPFASCFLGTGFYYTKGPALAGDIAVFERVAQGCQAIRRDGAAALDLALVAEGIYDGFWERGLQPWDVAAGSLLVSEAGGVVGNYRKRDEDYYDIEEISVVAGNAQTVDSLRKLIDMES